VTTATLPSQTQLLNDDRMFCEKIIQIEDRHRKLIPFKFNPAQELLYANLTGRDLVIKAGQLGITSFFLARSFKETITHPGTTAAVVAHEEFLTQRLLHRVRTMYLNMPDIIYTSNGPMKKPVMQHDSANEKSFPALNSVFYIGTARAFVFGRGEPIHRFLGSEVAFWPDAERILVPTMQRVPLDGEMVLESTPNGEGGPFYNYVMDSVDGKGVWKLHTLSWWLEPEYRLPRGSKYTPEWNRDTIKHFTEEELALAKKAKWGDKEADERIRWRRHKIKEIQDLFWQEFYEDLTSCFMSSGSMYYDSEETERLRVSCYPPNRVMTLPTTGGEAKIWFEPDSDGNPVYLISVDPGQGKITQSVATVWEIGFDGSTKHMATLSGLYDPQTFGPMVEELGKFYLTARKAAERNGHGMAFCGAVSEYPNLYRQSDIISNIPTKVIGWATTGAARVDGKGTKSYMMSELNHCLGDMECHDEDIIRQIRQVRVGPDRRLVFLSSDDFHDSAAIMAATKSTVMFSNQGGFVGSKGWTN
jgi:hypothetical protein